MKLAGYLIYCVYFYYYFKIKDLFLTSTLPSTQLLEFLPWFTCMDSILWMPVSFLHKLFYQLLWRRSLSFSKDVFKLKYHFIIALQQHFNHLIILITYWNSDLTKSCRVLIWNPRSPWHHPRTKNPPCLLKESILQWVGPLLASLPSKAQVDWLVCG